MKNALVNMAKAFGQMLDAHYMTFDRETNELITALANWVEKNSPKEPNVKQHRRT